MRQIMTLPSGRAGSRRFSVAGKCAITILALGLLDSALAQTQAPTNGDADGHIAEVVVTGSRIKTNDRNANPLTVVTTAQIEATKGATIDDVLSQLPDLDNNGAGSSNNQNSNGSNSASTVSLRSLGYSRTLVLMDGLRLIPTGWGGATASVDLSAIPSSIIERVEILKDGASSIYGADAIGGVVNIITKKNFTGVMVDGSGGIAGEGDGKTYSGQLTVGASRDSGHFTVSAGMVHQDGIRARDRSWASDQFLGTDAAGFGPASSRAPGFITNMPGVGQVYFYGPQNQFVVVRPEGGEPTDVLAAMGIAPPEGVFFLPGVGYRFNLSTGNDLVSSRELKGFTLNGAYNITPSIAAVVSAYFTDKSGTLLLNPDQESIATTTIKYPGFYIPENLESYGVDPVTGEFTRTVVGGPNPGNPFGITLAGNTRIQAGTRSFTNSFRTYRIATGLKGTVGDDYDWNLGYVYGRSHGIFSVTNSINNSHLAQLTGQLPCGPDVIVDCSVANFLGVNTLNQSQIDYLVFDNRETNDYGQQFFYGDISGPIHELPAGPLTVAVGAEYRQESFSDNPSPLDINVDTRTPKAPTVGDYDVKSAYAEINTPIVSNRRLAKELTFIASGRYDRYSNFGSATTWKAGLNYAVTEDFRLRSSKSTAFRAPGITQLFGGKSFSGQAATDPCSTDNGQFQGSPQCVADLTAVGQDPTTFVSSLSGAVFSTGGGNPDLQPETADFFGVGAVVTPRVFPNLSLSVDYYRITVSDAISAFSAQSVLSACYGPENVRCNQITRGPTGDINNVDTFVINAGGERTSGIDFATNFYFDASAIGLGRVVVDGSAVHIIEHKAIGADGSVTEKSGGFSFGTDDAEPEWKAKLGLQLLPNEHLSFGWSTRYLGGVKNIDDPTPGPGNQAGDIFYHDVFAGYQNDQLRITLGVNNLFDKDPPFLADGATNSLATAGYDYVGRFMFLRASVKW